MGKYDEMLKEQLRQLCSDRGLPVSGTNPELIERLELYDAAEEAERTRAAEAAPDDDDDDDLVRAAGGDDSGEATGLPDDPTLAEALLSASEAAGRAAKPVDDTSSSDPTPTGVDEPTADPPRSVRYEFECGDDFSNGLHHRFIQQTRERALADGHQPRGGAYRVDFAGSGPRRRAVYEILLRRR